jgi:hypothetical protein
MVTGLCIGRPTANGSIALILTRASFGACPVRLASFSRNESMVNQEAGARQSILPSQAR